MDEADTYLEQRGDEFRGILNSGHTRDAAVVWRTDGDKYEPKAFSTWAPIAIAKIGKLPDTLASRSIIILMRRKRADESVTRYRPDRDGPLLDELARKCARWAQDNLQNLKGADPMMPKQSEQSCRGQLETALCDCGRNRRRLPRQSAASSARINR